MDDSKKNKYKFLLRAYMVNHYSQILVNDFHYLIRREGSRKKVIIVDFIETYDGFKPRHKTVHLSLDSYLWIELVKVYISYFCKNLIPDQMKLRKVYSDSYPFKKIPQKKPAPVSTKSSGIIVIDTFGQVEIDSRFKPIVKNLIKDMWK